MQRNLRSNISVKTRDKATDENKQFRDKGEPHYLFEVKKILDLEPVRLSVAKTCILNDILKR